MAFCVISDRKLRRLNLVGMVELALSLADHQATPSAEGSARATPPRPLSVFGVVLKGCRRVGLRSPPFGDKRATGELGRVFSDHVYEVGEEVRVLLACHSRLRSRELLHG